MNYNSKYRIFDYGSNYRLFIIIIIIIFFSVLVHDDGRASVPVRLDGDGSADEPASMAVHLVLPHASPVLWQFAELPYPQPRCLGDGHERAGHEGGPHFRRISSRLVIQK